MSDVKRYNLFGHQRPDGQMVDYTDYQAALEKIASLEAENERLRLHDISGYREGVAEIQSKYDALFSDAQELRNGLEAARFHYVETDASMHKQIVNLISTFDKKYGGK